MDTVLQLTRLTGPHFALNPDLIERAEATPDTVVTLVNGSKYVVRESVDELIALVREYRAELVAAAQQNPAQVTDDERHHAANVGTTARHAGQGTVVFLHSETGGQ